MTIIVVWMAGTLNPRLIKFVVINSQGFQIGEVQYPLGPGRDRSVFLWVAPVVRSQNRGNSQLDNFDFCGNILCLNSELLTRAGRVPEKIQIRAYQNIREWNAQVVSADANHQSGALVDFVGTRIVVVVKAVPAGNTVPPWLLPHSLDLRPTVLPERRVRVSCGRQQWQVPAHILCVLPPSAICAGTCYL